MGVSRFVDRLTRRESGEPVFAECAMGFLYDTKFGRAIAALWSRFPLFSALCGWMAKQSWTKGYILRFINRFQIKTGEIVKPVSEFSSFNDFFIRKLKAESRPIATGEEICIAPADGFYLVFPNVKDVPSVFVKTREFSLPQLLGSQELAGRYVEGSMVIARLAVFDYHRYHFPVDGTPSPDSLIKGNLFSVHPKSMRQNFSVLSENKRKLTILRSPVFGEVLYLEVGALNVGSIVQTFTPGRFYAKGDEKGFFQFGASTIILLFQKQRIVFDDDLRSYSADRIEAHCLMGQSLGRAMLRKG